MSRPRYGWWGYVKSMIRRYPGGEATPEEQAAVQATIAITERMRDGQARLKVIDLVLWQGIHIPGAAIQIPCSERTAQRWHADFIRETARNFRCNGLIP